MTCTQCTPWKDGYCDFGCKCDDCNANRAAGDPPGWHRIPEPPACGHPDCEERALCRECTAADLESWRDHERDHSAARLG